MTSIKKAEFMVIGGGLAGLTIAAALSKSNRHVVIMEAAETWGGQARATLTPHGHFGCGFKTLPYFPGAFESLAIFESTLGISLAPEVVTRPMLTYHKNQFMPFVGFGAEKPVGYDALQYYLNPKSMKTQFDPDKWVDRLNDIHIGGRYAQSGVTRMEVVQQGKHKAVKRVEVNGQDIWEVSHVIYCGPLRDLPMLLGKENFGAKAAQKVAENTYWTAVSLDLVMKKPVETLVADDGTEKPLPDLASLFVLSGGTQPFQAMVGQFLSAQHSQWLTFVPFEFVQNDESSAAALKEMKRQIARAFGKEFMAQVDYERIVVSPGSHGEVSLKMRDHQTVSDVTNVSVISPFLKAPYNILGLGLQIGEVLEGLVTLAADVSVAPSLEA